MEPFRQECISIVKKEDLSDKSLVSEIGVKCHRDELISGLYISCDCVSVSFLPEQINLAVVSCITKSLLHKRV